MLTQDVLCREAARRLHGYLAALEGDEALLKALWIKKDTERYSVNDMLALLECFAHVQTHDQEIIHDLISVFETDMLFGAKYDMMITLGQIGSVAGIRAAHTIRRTMNDSQAWVIAAQDRVLERLETADGHWKRCGDCCFGRVHNKNTYGECACPACYGIGYLPLSTLQSQARNLIENVSRHNPGECNH